MCRRWGFDDGDDVKRVLLALAVLVGTAAVAAAQSPTARPTASFTPWGNFDWSQVAMPRVTLPQSFAPLTTIPGSVAPPSGASLSPTALASPAPANSAPAARKPAGKPPSSHQAMQQAVPVPPPAPSRRMRAAAAVPAAEDRDTLQAEPAPPPPEPPLAILLDGLGVYVQQDYVGVSALARPLQQQGFRTLVDNHFMRKAQALVAQGQAPAVIIGHSMGGQSALKLARQLVQSGYPAPDVITIDAAPMPSPCAVSRCTNIFSPGFPQVVGAQNISAWDHGAYMVNHAMLASNPAVQRMILQYTENLIAERSSQRVAARRPPGG
jgi:hypothetical protein